MVRRGLAACGGLAVYLIRALMENRGRGFMEMGPLGAESSKVYRGTLGRTVICYVLQRVLIFSILRPS